MNGPILSLVGMPGAGKTTVGRRLARELGLPFHDSDDEIVRRIGMSISRFFAIEGETAFRDLEQQVVADLARQQQRCVVATGGGTVLRPSNRDVLRSAGTVVYLHAAPEALFQRLRHNTQRPLLQVEDPLRRLQELFEQRDAFYRQTAHLVVDSGHSSAGSAAHRLLSRLEAHACVPQGT